VFRLRRACSWISRIDRENKFSGEIFGAGLPFVCGSIGVCDYHLFSDGISPETIYGPFLLTLILVVLLHGISGFGFTGHFVPCLIKQGWLTSVLSAGGLAS
jgi:hypothetical protein